MRWKSFPFEYFQREPITARQPDSVRCRKTERKCENDAECNTLNTIHTQLFELCITDFTKSCHLSHRFFLLLQSVLLCVCASAFTCNFFLFAKNLKHVITTEVVCIAFLPLLLTARLSLKRRKFHPVQMKKPASRQQRILSHY